MVVGSVPRVTFASCNRNQSGDQDGDCGNINKGDEIITVEGSPSQRTRVCSCVNTGEACYLAMA